MSQITLPELIDLERAVVEMAYSQGWPVKRISRETGLPYTAVYFYTVCGGIPSVAMTPAESSQRGLEARRLKRQNGNKNA